MAQSIEGVLEVPLLQPRHIPLLPLGERPLPDPIGNPVKGEAMHHLVESEPQESLGHGSRDIQGGPGVLHDGEFRRPSVERGEGPDREGRVDARDSRLDGLDEMAVLVAPTEVPKEPLTGLLPLGVPVGLVLREVEPTADRECLGEGHTGLSLATTPI